LIHSEAEAHTGLGMALLDQHKIDDAIAGYKKAIDLDPRYALAHRNLSIALRRQGKNDAADAELKKALELEQKP
jgi:Tfp pilus assembly protein PilF